MRFDASVVEPLSHSLLQGGACTNDECGAHAVADAGYAPLIWSHRNNQKNESSMKSSLPVSEVRATQKQGETCIRPSFSNSETRGEQILLMDTPDFARRMLTTHAANYTKTTPAHSHFSECIADGIVTATGPRWATQRTLLAPLFCNSDPLTLCAALLDPITDAVAAQRNPGIAAPCHAAGGALGDSFIHGWGINE